MVACHVFNQIVEAQSKPLLEKFKGSGFGPLTLIIAPQIQFSRKNLCINLLKQIHRLFPVVKDGNQVETLIVIQTLPVVHSCPVQPAPAQHGLAGLYSHRTAIQDSRGVPQTTIRT